MNNNEKENKPTIDRTTSKGISNYLLNYLADEKPIGVMAAIKRDLKKIVEIESKSYHAPDKVDLEELRKDFINKFDLTDCGHNQIFNFFKPHLSPPSVKNSGSDAVLGFACFVREYEGTYSKGINFPTGLSIYECYELYSEFLKNKTR